MKIKKYDLLVLLIIINIILTIVTLAVVSSKGTTKVQINEQQQGQEGQQGQQLERVNIDIGDSPVLGNENAPVTIIEFSDFECPFCGRAYRTVVKQIEKDYVNNGKVKIIFKNFPLTNLHPYAEKAAEAAMCAHEQDKFWEYHDMLFQNQDALTIDDLKNYAKQLGLDMAKFNECLDSGKMESKVNADFQQGLKAGVQGTPTFFINGIKVVGAQPYDVFKQIIENELS